MREKIQEYTLSDEYTFMYDTYMSAIHIHAKWRRYIHMIKSIHGQLASYYKIRACYASASKAHMRERERDERARDAARCAREKEARARARGERDEEGTGAPCRAYAEVSRLGYLPVNLPEGLETVNPASFRK